MIRNSAKMVLAMTSGLTLAKSPIKDGQTFLTAESDEALTQDDFEGLTKYLY